MRQPIEPRPITPTYECVVLVFQSSLRALFNIASIRKISVNSARIWQNDGGTISGSTGSRRQLHRAQQERCYRARGT
jgi:hypothetical protein